MNRNLATVIACLFLIALFIACGGGGVTAPSSTTVTAIPSPSESGTSSPPSEANATVTESPSAPESTVNSSGASRSGEVITAEEYARIRMGMTYNDVVGVIGAYGEEISRSSIGDYETVMFQWMNTGFLDASNANVTFQNGRAIAKAQFALPSRPGSEQQEPDEVDRPLNAEEKEAIARAEEARREERRQQREVERKRAEAERATALAQAAFRQFTAAKGDFSVRARFVGMEGEEKVVLRREDNSKVITVSLDQLSDADREWISERRKGNGQH